MRLLALLAVALIALPACDTGGGTEPPPDENDPIAVIVRYRVTVTGTAGTLAVTYTGDDGEPVVTSVDFSRGTAFLVELTLEPGTEGTFGIAANGLVTDGNLVVTANTFRSDDESQIGTDSETATASGTEELAASASVQVAVITGPPGA